MPASNPFTFGQPFTFTFKPAASQPEAEKKEDEDDEHGGHDDAHHLEEESKAEFTPVVRLTAAVKVETMEEDEEVLYKQYDSPSCPCANVGC